jgi:drug/metabolite transporter (DMT)-like permease
MAVSLALFAVMSLIWGATWAAVKVGVTAVPPIFFAGMRFLLVSAILVLFVRGLADPFRDDRAGRTIASAVLVNVATYSLLFWGMQYVSSGVSGLINLSLIPVGLFALSILNGDEPPRWRHAVALALGLIGLVVLFADKATFGGNGMELPGAAAIIGATFSYCLGTVWSRPLLASLSPLQLTAAHALVGAAGLMLLAAVFEPLSTETLHALAAPGPLVSLLFLVVFGTVVAYAIYLRLVRDWGAPRAGLYAFVSPIVALVLGWLLFAEQIGWREIAGAAILLLAAALALRPRRA